MTTAAQAEGVDLAVLESVQRRIPWLATRIVDAADHDRPNTEGTKVGGHQASSASLVSARTARRSWSPVGALKWVEGPDGRHIGLGIFEMNLSCSSNTWACPATCRASR
ncbi:hypothetical protein OG216_40650 [Streptomycetaceae bacterium NBC_01309]